MKLISFSVLVSCVFSVLMSNVFNVLASSVKTCRLSLIRNETHSFACNTQGTSTLSTLDTSIFEHPGHTTHCTYVVATIFKLEYVIGKFMHSSVCNAKVAAT